MTRDMSNMDDVLKLPNSPDKRDLEWCAAIAQWTSSFPEMRAINIATGIACRLLWERAAEGKSD